jgi:hypothetical protein
VRDVQLFGSAGLVEAWELYRKLIFPKEQAENPLCRSFKRLGLLEDQVPANLAASNRVDDFKALRVYSTAHQVHTLRSFSYAIGAKARDEDLPHIDDAFNLPDELLPQMVIDGLQRFFESLLSKKHNIDNLDLVLVDNIVIGLTVEEDWVTIRLSPIGHNGAVHQRIDAEGWDRLSRTVLGLCGTESSPDPSKNDSSQAVLAALGVTSNRWPDRFLIKRSGSAKLTRETATGSPIAEIVFERGALLARYWIRPKAS